MINLPSPNGRGIQGEGANISGIGNVVKSCSPDNDKTSTECELMSSSFIRRLNRPLTPSPSPAGRGVKAAFTLAEVFSRHSDGQRRAAFTLAEVLITLGIIGVVAAMTLPTLIQNHRKHVVETKLKKFYTTMNQAVLMAKSDFGDYQDWDFWVENSWDEDTGTNRNQCDKVRSSFEKYLKPYLNIVKTSEFFDEDGKKINYLYYLSDGSLFYFGYYSTADIFYLTDEKCRTSKDFGRCKFIFQFKPLDKNPNWIKYRNKGVEPYKMLWMNDDVNFLYNDSLHGCNANGEKHYCAAVIQLNGWRIPDNYPVKF